MHESVSAATDLDLISYLKAIPDTRMRRGVRIPAWFLLLVAVLGILSRCQSLRDLERFSIRHHSGTSLLLCPYTLRLSRYPADFVRSIEQEGLYLCVHPSTLVWMGFL